MAILDNVLGKVFAGRKSGTRNHRMPSWKRIRRVTMEQVEPRMLFSAGPINDLAQFTVPALFTGMNQHNESGLPSLSPAVATNRLGSSLGRAPAAPRLTATAVSSSEIDLAWKSVSGATGYVVDEWVNDAWVELGTLARRYTGCSITGLSADTTYYFDVGAYNAAGVSWAPYQGATTAAAAVTTGEPTAATAYAPVSGSLFGAKGPSYLDVHQGQVGVCWLMSSLAEVATRDPADIRNMFTSDGTTVENGVTVDLYSVRFFNSAGVAQSVTVDTELPSGGAYYDQVENGILWVALAEKAYAEANGAGIVTTGSVGSDSYDALDGGDPAWALQAITGQAASDFDINPSNIAAAWKAGELIVLGSSPNANDNLIVGDSTGTHAYAVVKYTASSSSPFELYNPWGVSSVVGSTTTFNGHKVYGGPFNASAALISKDFDMQAIGTGAAAGMDGLNGAWQNTANVFSNVPAPLASTLNRSQADNSIPLPAPGIMEQNPVPDGTSAAHDRALQSVVFDGSSDHLGWVDDLDQFGGHQKSKVSIPAQR